MKVLKAIESGIYAILVNLHKQSHRAKQNNRIRVEGEFLAI